MQKITVKITELMGKLARMQQDGMDFAELTIVDEETVPAEAAPAFLHLLGIRKQSSDPLVDYESVDAISGADLRGV